MVSVRRRGALVSARKAAGLTQEKLAEVMSVERSTVIRWEAGDHTPLPFQWPKLAMVLGCSTDELRDLIDVRPVPGSAMLGSALEPAFSWLDRHVRWSPGTTRGKVEAIVPAARRGEPRVGRSRLVAALAGYYGDPPPGYSMYTALSGDAERQTSIVTRPEWTDLACPLTFQADQITLQPDVGHVRRDVDEVAAVGRLAEAATDDVRIADVPIYRLAEIEIRPGTVVGKVSLVSFVEYALSVDLLERELTDNSTAGKPLRPGNAPLRDKYLPDFAAALDPAGRLCAGGVLALTAIARPANPHRGAADYVLLVQERSDRVVNAAGRLAVIPKAFHQPLTDHRADARIGATLRRALEKELFGRVDVDNTAGAQRAADPMHPRRLSAPMRWLTEQPDRLRMECTGFGFNLVSGNYEFASLVVIDDEDFWTRFGGEVEANWESARLRLYSTLDDDLINRLIADESWSNEGLFSLLQGLRRLTEIGGDRMAGPPLSQVADGHRTVMTTESASASQE
jgi:transcriptional regulator with XRE-family HTH domain